MNVLFLYPFYKQKVYEIIQIRLDFMYFCVFCPYFDNFLDIYTVKNDKNCEKKHRNTWKTFKIYIYFPRGVIKFTTTILKTVIVYYGFQNGVPVFYDPPLL